MHVTLRHRFVCRNCEVNNNLNTHCTVWCFKKPKYCILTPQVPANFKQSINDEKSFTATLSECFATPDERWADSSIRTAVEDLILSYHGKTVRISITEVK